MISAFLSDMYIHSLHCLRLLGRGAEIVASEVDAVLHRRFPTFPWIGSNAADPWTLSDTMFSQNRWTVGLSLRPPAARWFPKNASTGSWHSFSDSTYCTPETANKICVISTNEWTVSSRRYHESCKYLYMISLPVILNPSSVASKSCILFRSPFLKPSRFNTLSSQSLRYFRNPSFNHYKHDNYTYTHNNHRVKHTFSTWYIPI